MASKIMEKKFTLENLPELKKRYSISEGGYSMIFYIMSLDVDKNEAYLKVVHPFSTPMGVQLLSLLEKPFKEEIEP